MKRLLIFGMFVTGLIFSQLAHAQTVDEVINKNIAAIGGKENIAKIQNVVMEGKLTIQGAEITLTITGVNNKLSRQDINAMGMKGYMLLTNTEGWMYMPFQGMQKPEPRTDEEVKQSQTDLDIFGPLVDYAAKGNKVELLGKEDVEGTECFKIKLTTAYTKEITYFIDPVSYFIIRVKEKSKVNGKEIENQTDVSDYRDIEGVKMPYSIAQQFGTVIITSIKTNQTIPDSAYKHDM